MSKHHSHNNITNFDCKSCASTHSGRCTKSQHVQTRKLAHAWRITRREAGRVPSTALIRNWHDDTLVPMTRVHTASAQPAAVNASLPTQTPLQQTCQEIHTYDTIPTWGYTGLQQDFNKESTSSNSSRTMSTDLLRRKKPFVRASANTAQTRPCWSTTTQLQTSAGVVYIHTMSAHGVNRHLVSADTVNNAHIQQHEQARHQRYRMDSKHLLFVTLVLLQRVAWSCSET